MLERLQLVLRLREPFEAIDLGFALLRRHARAVYLAWAVVVLPLVVLVYGFLFGVAHAQPWLPPLLVWWLRPLLDRPVLHILSKATFGESPTLRDTLKSLPSLLRRGAVATLLWRRVDLARTFALPLWQLEGQTGQGYRQRRKILTRRNLVQAQGLTVACFAFEVVLALTLLVGIQYLLPVGAEFDLFERIFASNPADRLKWVDLLVSLLPVLTATAVEPLLVAAGFSLYLNRRVQLEGWDLELAFRRLAARLLRVGAALSLLVGFTLNAREPRPYSKAETHAALQEVLKAQEFQTRVRKKGLHWKAREEKPAPDLNAPWWWESWQGLLGVLAKIVKWILIGSGLAAVGWFLWHRREALGGALGLGRAFQPPAAILGLDIRPGSLPKDIEGTALGLLRAGDPRAALALLYRASLAELVHRHRLELGPGATEGDCLGAASGALPPAPLAYFEALTAAWRLTAYARQNPEGAEALCRSWAASFRGAP